MKKILLSLLVSFPLVAETKIRNAITQGAPISVLDKGAPCDGLNDDQPAFARAVAALPSTGGTIDARACIAVKFASSLTLSKPMNLLLGHAAVSLGTSQILITANNARILGTGGSGFGSFGGLQGTTFTYSGTGAAIDIGDGTNPIYHVAVKGVQIATTGSAVASATAIGIRCRNCRYAVLDEPTIGGAGTGFEGGVGIEFRATGTSFDATNQIYNPNLFDNFYGVHFIGAAGPNGANDLKIYGGFIIGHSPVTANSYGIFADQFSDALKIYGTDVETYADNYHFSGTGSANHVMSAVRSEFPTTNHFYIGAGVTNVQFYGFTPESPGYSAAGTCAAGAVNCYTDLGSNTTVLDALGFKGRGLTIKPSTNVSEVLSVTKADGTTTVLDLSTNGSPRLELPSGTNLTMYSDAFVTQKFNVDGATGKVTPGSFTFANIAVGPVSNSTFGYCSDCTIANPCAGGGTGALAKRLNGVWVCN